MMKKTNEDKEFFCGYEYNQLNIQTFYNSSGIIISIGVGYWQDPKDGKKLGIVLPVSEAKLFLEQLQRNINACEAEYGS